MLHHNKGSGRDPSRGFSARTGRRNGEAATGILDQILTRANRRHLLNASFDYLAIAAGAGALGAIALLLTGTQILNWYWPVILFVIAAAAGAWKLRKRALSRYAVAQMLDERLGLADRLSTIVWFQERETPEALATVEHQAAGRVQPDDVARAIPVRMPRHAWASCALILGAAGLFGVRYFVLNTMDLAEPIARVDFSFFTPEPKVEAATRKTAIQERFEKQLQELGLDAEDMQSPDGDALQPISAEVPGAADPAAPQGETKGQKTGQTPEDGEGGEEGQPGDQQEGADAENAEQGGEDGKQGKPQSGNPPPNAKQGQQQASNDGLMNKMKDALANLMNKLKTPGEKNQQQMAMNQQQQAGKEAAQSQQGMQSKSQGQGQQSPSEQQGDQQQGEQASGDKSKSGEQNSDKPGSEASKSGMGQSDGDKALKDAEQLAAMGKISEILGKRAQQITGEMTVEVSSGKQHLKTAWSERRAIHADTGGQVNRDEVPLAYQGYVQRYFEEIRKATPKPAAARSGSD